MIKEIKNKKNITNDDLNENLKKFNVLKNFDILVYKNYLNDNSKKIKKRKKLKFENDKLIVCNIHKDSKIEFICINNNCLKELCQFCILNHLIHIDSIKSLKEFYTLKYKKFFEKDENKISIKNVKKIEFSWIKLINNDFLKLKNILKKETKLNLTLNKNNYELKNQSNLCFENLDYNSLSKLKNYVLGNNKNKTFKFDINIFKKLMISKINNSIKNNLIIINEKNNFESTNENINKFLYWFDLQNKEINLFNLVTRKFNTLKLFSPLNLENKHKSILTKEGKIFLIGGRKNNKNIIKNKIFGLNLNKDKKLNKDKVLNKNKLKIKCKMIENKFDYSICIFDDSIYFISGRNSDKELTNSCEKYNYKLNTWEFISSIKNKRIGATAVVCKNLEKIFVFGGKLNNLNFCKIIEEYDIKKNKWSEINIIDNNKIWIPKENYGCVQIDFNKILIFGGFNPNEPKNFSTFIFNPITYSINKINQIKLNRIIKTTPIIYGKNWFAFGENNDNINLKNILKFDLENFNWDII